MKQQHLRVIAKADGSWRWAAAKVFLFSLTRGWRSSGESADLDGIRAAVTRGSAEVVAKAATGRSSAAEPLTGTKTWREEEPEQSHLQAASATMAVQEKQGRKKWEEEREEKTKAETYNKGR